MSPTTKLRIVRRTGALEESLPGIGVTVRGEPFDCPIPLAEQLLADQTGRWAAAKPTRGEAA